MTTDRCRWWDDQAVPDRYREVMPRLLELLRDPDRPLAISVVFWPVLALVVVRYYLTYEELDGLPPVLFGLNIAGLLALWLVMPWQPLAPRWRRLAAPGFLLTTLTLGMVGSAGIHFPLVLIGFAAVALVYGVVVAGVAAGATGAVFVAGGLWYAPADLLWVATEVFVVVSGAVFVLGMVAAIQEARQRREESDRLLARVRELTVAEERARMARDMHDSMGHHLTVIKMGLENAERFRHRRPEEAWHEVRQSKDLTVQALAETRRWVRALRPLDLGGRVGSAALQRLARSFDGSGITVDFTVAGPERELDADAELILYRVLQEGLTNVLRHAGATRVWVRLGFEPGTVTLAIGDDGQGSQAGPGFGLTSLAERVEAYGGRLRAGTGTGTGGYEVRAELTAVGR